MVSLEEFAKLDIRVGRIVAVEDHEKARKPMYKLTIDFGPEMGQRTVIAGIKDRYEKEELMNKKIACVVNLDPKKIAGVESQGMILAAEDELGTLSLLTADRDIKEGSRVR